MKPSLLATACTLLVLGACTQATYTEDQVKQAIDRANHCTTATDCASAGSRCPFGCNVYVHVEEAGRIHEMMEGFDSACTYKCMADNGAECVSGKCQAITEPSSDPEGNAGAACTANDECVTPMGYLMRSSCPFTSQCIDGACAVVCPMASKSEDPWHVACAKDSECECGGYADAGNRCACVQGQCVAVML